jgi:hypothetical protein
MPENRLYCWQIGPALHQMCGKTVAQAVFVLLMICAPRKSAIAITRNMGLRSS